MAERPHKLSIDEFKQQLEIFTSIKPLLEEFIRHLVTEQRSERRSMIFSPQRFKTLYDLLERIDMRGIRYTLGDKSASSERLAMDIRKLSLQKVQKQNEILQNSIDLLQGHIDFLEERSTTDVSQIVCDMVSTFNISGLQVTIEPYLH